MGFGSVFFCQIETHLESEGCLASLWFWWPLVHFSRGSCGKFWLVKQQIGKKVFFWELDIDN